MSTIVSSVIFCTLSDRERLSSWLSDQAPSLQGTDPHHVTALCDQQLMVEHAYDLRGRDRVLFIDAAARQGAPVHWQRVEASACGPAWSTCSWR